ncbi:hypothetical protein GCM10027052_25400 [Parafrigoribacterium mesophilum]|uniref:hypothetical protein n=1 Tax=Parafrigoribacterium mesophilum TaxID=433646 RepID=UPI0031FC6E12
MTSLTGVAGIMQCAHAAEEGCVKRGPGHALHPIQARAAAATGSKWIDGIVRNASTDGWIAVEPIGSGDTIWAWHHHDLSAQLSPGAPVALHSLYKVLAAGDTRVSVLTI